MSSLLERYTKQIAGTLSCFDRIIITGTIPGICYPEGMAGYLSANGIRLFDYPKFAEPLREELRENAENKANEANIQIELIRSAGAFRKEDRIKEILQGRGLHSGIVHIFSAMEPCPSFTAWHDKPSGRTMLKFKDGKCLHYYFYYIDENFGLCYMRVPTWAPFRLQFYCNGHNWLANQLTVKQIGFSQLDNTFTSIADWGEAQKLANSFPIEQLRPMGSQVLSRSSPLSKPISLEYYAMRTV